MTNVPIRGDDEVIVAAVAEAHRAEAQRLADERRRKRRAALYRGMGLGDPPDDEKEKKP